MAPRPPYVYAKTAPGVNAAPIVLVDGSGNPIVVVQDIGTSTVDVLQGSVELAAVVDRAAPYTPGTVQPVTMDTLGRTRVTGDPASGWSDRSQWSTLGWGNEQSVWG